MKLGWKGNNNKSRINNSNRLKTWIFWLLNKTLYNLIWLLSENSYDYRNQ